MSIQFFTHLLNGLLMVSLPIGLGILLSRKFSLGWRLWWIGAATFILAQIGHFPFNYLLTILFQRGVLTSLPQEYLLVFNAIILGLSAGLWEELSLYASYRWWAKDARSWAKALMLGAGRGGVEAIVLGILVLVNFGFMYAARFANTIELLPQEIQPLVAQQVNEFWNVPWYLTILGAVERFLALMFHLSASVLILQAFLRKRFRWVWLAVIWHTVIDTASVFVVGTWGPVAAELVLGGLTLVSIVIIIAFYQPEPEPEAEVNEEFQSSQPEAGAQFLPDIEETAGNLEDSRYEG